MIYGRDAIEDGMHAVMFPVAEVDVFAETEPGRHERIAGKKAIVAHDGFDLAAYLENPSRDLLRSASRRTNGRARRTRLG